MAEKITRKMFVSAALACDVELLATPEYQAVGEKMLASITKQAERPKGKTSARIQNESYARELCRLLADSPTEEVVNAKWIADHVRGVMTSQRGYHVAQIAIEWGQLEEVLIKKRTFYAKTDKFNLENIPR
jgi:hypothetical protein